MHSAKVELERCFLCSIDSAKAYVSYNGYTLDPGSEMHQYMLNLFAKNFDNISSKKASFSGDSFISQILPENVEGFDAFVDVVADEIHTLVQEAVDLPSGSGLFLWATVEEQPIIAFFKLNYQNKFTCLVSDDSKEVSWEKVYRLLPAYTQNDYDYFYINIFDRKVWMSDTVCHIELESFNYMSDRILHIEKLDRSEKEVVSVIRDAAVSAIEECYKKEAPSKVFEYRNIIADAALDYDVIKPVEVEKKLFADNEDAAKVYRQKLKERDIPADKPQPVSKKTQRQLQKKQKIVTESGIEILVPIEFLEDSEVFEYKQDELGHVSITINDTNGTLK